MSGCPAQLRYRAITAAIPRRLWRAIGPEDEVGLFRKADELPQGSVLD